MIDPTHFSHAILRTPADSAVNGLRAVDRGAPDVTGLRREHTAYRQALEDLGVSTVVLPALEAYPDSMFVEDPALVFPEGAILLRPGTQTRLGETGEIASALEQRFDPVYRIDRGFADGGDVLVTAREVLIGLSERTDSEGAECLKGILERLGRKVRAVTPPPGVLHFKTACSLVARDTILITEELLAGTDCFSGYATIVVAGGEEPAANALGVNGTVLLAAGFPETAARLTSAGLGVRTLPLDNVMKLDAGLSCMSLRW